MAAARTHSLESHLPSGFVMDKGAFVGPVHVMEERAVDTSSRLAFSDVRAVYRGYTPPKPSSEEFAEGLDEKADALMESPSSWTPDFSAGKGRVNESPLSAASSCTAASSSPDAPERPRPVLIVIDNDECIGSWGTSLRCLQ